MVFFLTLRPFSISESIFILILYSMFSELFEPLTSAKILCASILSICFLQSAIDKTMDWNGNLSWLKGHFANTFLGGFVPALLAIVTLVEFLAGAFSGAGIFTLLLNNNNGFILYGAQLSALSLVMLFFGQRIAKDYAGAATLIGYFLLSILTILLVHIS